MRHKRYGKTGRALSTEAEEAHNPYLPRINNSNITTYNQFNRLYLNLAQDDDIGCLEMFSIYTIYEYNYSLQRSQEF